MDFWDNSVFGDNPNEKAMDAEKQRQLEERMKVEQRVAREDARRQRREVSYDNCGCQHASEDLIKWTQSNKRRT